jgi:hypothetical protein
LVASASFYLQPGGYSGSGLVRYSAAGARDTNFGFRGALGGVSSFGLDTGGVLLDPTAGTAYAAQQNGGGFGITRFALGAPATIAVASESSVCALAVAGKLGPLVRTRKLDVSLRLRAPGRLRIRAVASVGGRSVAVGQVTVLRPFIEGAVATIGVSAAATRLLRGAKSARLKITAGAPGAAATTSTITLRR